MSSHFTGQLGTRWLWMVGTAVASIALVVYGAVAAGLDRHLVTSSPRRHWLICYG